MKPLGVIKTIDNAGRLGIPAEIRARLGLYGKVELIMTDEGLLIRKNPKQSCSKSKFSLQMLTKQCIGVIIDERKTH